MSTGRDLNLIGMLAISNLMFIPPAVTACIWHLLYGKEYSFYKWTISKGFLCKSTFSLSLLTTQVSTSLLFIIAMSRYVGIIKHIRLSARKSFSSLLLTWSFWGAVTVSILYTTPNIEMCFLWERLHDNHFLIFSCGCFNIAACAVVCGLYSTLIQETWKAHKKRHLLCKSGKKNIYISVLVRLVLIMVVVAVSLCPANLILLLSSFYDIPRGNMIVVFIVCSLFQTVMNPLTYTITTNKFKSWIVQTFKS